MEILGLNNYIGFIYIIQRDFDNKTLNISDIYTTQTATNSAISFLPTKSDVATSIVYQNSFILFYFKMNSSYQILLYQINWRIHTLA